MTLESFYRLAEIFPNSGLELTWISGMMGDSVRTASRLRPIDVIHVDDGWCLISCAKLFYLRLVTQSPYNRIKDKLGNNGCRAH